MKELEAIRELAGKWRDRIETSAYKYEDADMVLSECSSELSAPLPALETEVAKLEDEIAALREPMSCTHPRACWKERDSKLSKGPMGTEYREGYCTACEHKRLAVAAALEEAAVTAKQYGLGHEGDSIAAAIRALKREKRGGE